LIAQGLNLPQNTTVHVKSFPTGELYLEFIYPPNPSLRSIRRGEVLEGISPYSIEEFMLGQNISGVTDVVSIHVIKALQATEIANIEMKNFFENTSSVIKDNKEGINASVDNTVAMTKSLAEMAENLNQAAQKINNSIDSQSIRESTSNIKDSSLNIKDSTSNLKDSSQSIKNTTDSIFGSTKGLDKTMNKVDDTISQINCAARNINCMTQGLNETLSKRFGGARVLFGTPVKKSP
jgi:methyl-accepting chemotaxis protein